MPQFETIALSDGDGKLVDVLIVPDGEVSLVDGRGGFSMTEDEADAIIDAFNRRGTQIVIDYQHQTLGREYSSPDGTAPAAGWIHGLRYQSGRGIVASVEWTPRARKSILAGEFRYLSPVLKLVKGDDGVRPYELEHAAVTNIPAIRSMERLAASRKNKDSKMAKGKKNNADQAPAELLNRIVWAFQEATPEEQAAVSADVVEQVDEVGVALANLKSMLGLPDGATPVQIINEAIAKIEGGGAEDGEGEEGGEEGMAASRVPSEVCEALSLKTTADVKAVVKEIDKMRATTVTATEHQAVLSRLESVEADNRDRKAKALVERFVEEGRINPNDESKMKWAMSRAKGDAEAFTELMTDAPKVVPTDRVSDEAEDKGHAERERIIATASSEHDRMVLSDSRLHGVEKWAYVNEVLRDKSHATLTKAERDKLGEKE